MSIELQFNSVVLRQDEIEEICPDLISAISSCLPAPTPKRRKRKKKKTISYLIDEIIDSIETK